jgi:hypothetical protein
MATMTKRKQPSRKAAGKAAERVASKAAVRTASKAEWTPAPELVKAKATPDVVTTPRRKAVAIDGAGAPAGAAFTHALGALYGVTYTLKFTRKKSGRSTQFKVGPLEGRWSAEGVHREGSVPPPETWIWRMRLPVPPDVTKAELAETLRAVTHKKGGKLEGSAVAGKVFLEDIPACRCGRMLHVGPYADEPRSFARMIPVMEAAGLKPVRPHIEIYLNDPGRTKPDKLKTVLLKEGA